MGATTNIEFHQSDPAVQAVIAEGNATATSGKRNDDADYLSQAGFELVQDEIVTGSPETFEVYGVVKQTYVVRELPNHAYVDKFTLEVPAKFYIEASLKYQAWVDQALTQAEKSRLTQLLADFVAGPMDAPEKFSAKNNVDFDAFAAEPYFVFARSLKAPVLLDDYEKEVVANLQQSERFTLELRDSWIELGDINTEDKSFDVNDPGALQAHLQQEYEEVSCAEYQIEVPIPEHDIAEIIKYSEFKTIIAWKWIKITHARKAMARLVFAAFLPHLHGVRQREIRPVPQLYRSGDRR